jgi:hypothetical protein
MNDSWRCCWDRDRRCPCEFPALTNCCKLYGRWHCPCPPPLH